MEGAGQRSAGVPAHLKATFSTRYGPASRSPPGASSAKFGVQGFAGVRTSALGADLTGVSCKGEWLPLGITVDPISGLALTIDALTAEDSQSLKAWIEPIAASVGVQVLVTDDADGFKTVADEVGVQHQTCKAHVLRNIDALIERYQPLVASDADGSLHAIGMGVLATFDIRSPLREGRTTRGAILSSVSLT